MKKLCAFAALLCGCQLLVHAESKLEADWNNPPPDARVRAYWWWLNGNVDKAAITRDLEQMKAKGFGGALICDADGSSQDGNARAPHGPTFFSPEWRELYKHTLREADRLGLEMSLNIQSGWNLGGPMVKPEDAPKKLIWSETQFTGGSNTSATVIFNPPASRDNFYRDLFVLAYPIRRVFSIKQAPAVVSASSAQPNQDARLTVDGNITTFWVSSGTESGQGPTPENPQWLQLEYADAVAPEALSLTPRDNYGPRECELQASDDGKSFRTVQSFTARSAGETKVSFPAAKGRVFRLVITGAFDPKYPQSPRNAQVAEIRLLGKDGNAVGSAPVRKPLQNQREKALLEPLKPFSAPDSAPLFQEFPPTLAEEDAHTADVLDLTTNLAPDGTLVWNAPPGGWRVIRFGYTLNDHCRVSTCSEGWDGYAIDPFDDGAFTRYWDAVVEPLIADAGPLAGKALKYLHTDSWEVEVANWTPHLREEFQKRRGYDPLPWLPVIAGKIINSRDEANRFLHDFRRTMGDLAIDHHYKLFKERAHAHGLLIHPESGGPHAVPIDAQQCLGFNDAPMSEFWAWSWRHRIGDENRFFVKQPASAAHTYGRKLVLAEGFTTIGPHWQETLWDNLKPSFDHALTEGLNLLVWHAFVCSPESEGIPGQQYFAGTHLNPNVTWWEKSKPFFDYINRCQAMLQQGMPVADVAYYYGDGVPNFARLRKSDPAKLGPGYDYDVVTEEVILNRMSVKDGKLVLPDGVSYRVLVLADRDVISLPVLRKLDEFVAAGATVIGPKPKAATGLKGFPASDVEVKTIADKLWDSGRISTRSVRDVLDAEGVKPDMAWSAGLVSRGPKGKGTVELSGGGAQLDFIHRRVGDAEIYFVANRSTNAMFGTCTFAVTGKVPELWNAVSGERRPAESYSSESAYGRTGVSMHFDPCGSWFIIFRESITAGSKDAGRRPFVSRHPVVELPNNWMVSFSANWAGAASAEFDSLVSWTERLEPGIKFYSGTATYTKSFELSDSAFRTPRSALWLDLGSVRELAEVRVNGQSCGITWTPPFRVDITKAVTPGQNKLEVEVVNFWPNRIIGDAGLPKEQRLTRTNIRKLTMDTPLMPSGLLGPVRVLEQQ